MNIYIYIKYYIYYIYDNYIYICMCNMYVGNYISQRYTIKAQVKFI